MFYVYILRSAKDGKRYVGMTENLERRMNEHESGRVKSTKNRRPLKQIHTETYSTKQEAEAREKFYKTGKGREYLNQIGK